LKQEHEICINSQNHSACRTGFHTCNIGFFSELGQSTKTGSDASVGTNIFPKANIAYGATDNGNVSGTGTTTHLNFEGGFYGIISDDGNHYDPSNLDPEFQVDGLRARFMATTLNAVTYHMWGISIRISHIERLDEIAVEIKPNAHNCSGDLDKLTTPLTAIGTQKLHGTLRY
jgi:hypothetical protein